MTSPKPPSIALIGDPGGGKTYSITTLIECGLEVFVLITESGGLDSLLDSVRDRNLPIDKLHWHVVLPATPHWSALLSMVKKVNQLSYSDLADMKQGIDKDKCNQLWDVLTTVQNFPCDRTGQKYGDITEWDATRAFVVDSLTGLNEMCWQNTVGLKPTAHQGEWGVAMNVELQLINKFTSLGCYFVCTAHVDREPDEIAGGTHKMMAALGRKNAPKIARLFSEIVLCKRNPTDKKLPFVWSTADNDTVVKARALSFSGTLIPHFRSIYDIHNQRVAAAAAEAPAPTKE